jgi:anti-sigma B factor antagonist
VPEFSESPFPYPVEPTRRIGELGNQLLQLETVREGSGAVVFTRGELDMASGPALLRRLLEVLSLPIDTLNLNLAELAFIDSSGISALNTARNVAGEKGVTFMLRSVPDQARKVLELTDMLSLFGLNDAPALPDGFD